MNTPTKIYVGRITYEDGKMVLPKKEGCKRIVVMMKSHSKWFPLSPYYLRTEEGYILENNYQFKKLNKTVPQLRTRYSNWDRTVIWNHNKETHVDSDGNPNEKYYAWRTKGLNNPYAVRYPAGYTHRHECICHITDDGRRLSYVEAREEIYVQEYNKAAIKVPEFEKLLKLARKHDILICEVDGPHQESNEHYSQTYGTPLDWIEDDCVEINERANKIMLKDEKHSYGHGYALAYLLYKMLNVS